MISKWRSVCWQRRDTRKGRGCRRSNSLVRLQRQREVQDIIGQWREHLGIEVSPNPTPSSGVSKTDAQISFHGWVADYPDPDTFLRNITAYTELRQVGWQNPRYTELVDEAARTTDRARRIKCPVEADSIWVAQEAVVCPLGYRDYNLALVKPWVKKYVSNRCFTSPTKT